MFNRNFLRTHASKNFLKQAALFLALLHFPGLGGEESPKFLFAQVGDGSETDRSWKEIQEEIQQGGLTRSRRAFQEKLSALSDLGTHQRMNRLRSTRTPPTWVIRINGEPDIWDKSFISGRRSTGLEAGESPATEYQIRVIQDARTHYWVTVASNPNERAHIDYGKHLMQEMEDRLVLDDVPLSSLQQESLREEFEEYAQTFQFRRPRHPEVATAWKKVLFDSNRPVALKSFVQDTLSALTRRRKHAKENKKKAGSQANRLRRNGEWPQGIPRKRSLIPSDPGEFSADLRKRIAEIEVWYPGYTKAYAAYWKRMREGTLSLRKELKTTLSPAQLETVRREEPINSSRRQNNVWTLKHVRLRKAIVMIIDDLNWKHGKRIQDPEIAAKVGARKINLQFTLEGSEKVLFEIAKAADAKVVHIDGWKKWRLEVSK